MFNIKRWYRFRDFPLRKKIQVVNFMAITIGILLLTLCLYRISLDQAAKRAASSSEQKLAQMTSTISILLNGIENYSKLTVFNNLTQSLLSEEKKEDEPTEPEMIRLMYVTLTSMVESNPHIDSVIVQSARGEIYHSNNLSKVTAESLSLFPREKLDEAHGSPVWIQTYRPAFLFGQKHKNVLTLGKLIINMNTGKPIGYLYVNIDEKVLSSLYGHDEKGLQSQIMIVDRSGDILSANDEERLYESIRQKPYMDWIDSRDAGVRIFRDDRRNVLVAVKSLDKLDGKMVYIVPIANLMRDQWTITLLIVGFGAAGLLVAFLLSVVFSHRITEPLLRLRQAMGKVGDGDLDQRAPVTSRDEIGQLSLNFNQMVRRIQELLFRINDEEKQKRKLELQLMYSQIKPHFLYNTLEMIRSMALMISSREIHNVVKALADFYRLSLSDGKEFITVAQERKHVENYLYIQKMRYKKIDYRIEFDPRIEQWYVPIMLLQPLVENAIQHGLRGRQQDGLCEIRGLLENEAGKAGSDGPGEERLCFIVKDNGIGMTREQIEQIGSKILKKGDFGIRNVQERIQLRYGERYGLTILSEIGKGVEVQVRLPKIGEPDGNEERM